MTDKKIKVIIVDDHMVVRRGLSHVIQSFKDIELIAEAESGEEALLLCRQLQPDVVLMDVKMEGMGGIAAAEATRKFHPQTQVVALSTFQNKDIVEKMIQAGAIGYILKDISAKGLAGAIRSAYAGKPAFASEIAQALKSTPPPSDLPGANLSARQKKVLALLAAGLSNAEIAVQLTISHSTARYHVSAILIKLDVSNRAEAAVLAIKHGLIAD